MPEPEDPAVTVSRKIRDELLSQESVALLIRDAYAERELAAERIIDAMKSDSIEFSDDDRHHCKYRERLKRVGSAVAAYRAIVPKPAVQHGQEEVGEVGNG